MKVRESHYASQRKMETNLISLKKNKTLTHCSKCQLGTFTFCYNSLKLSHSTSPVLGQDTIADTFEQALNVAIDTVAYVSQITQFITEERKELHSTDKSGYEVTFVDQANYQNEYLRYFLHNKNGKQKPDKFENLNTYYQPAHIEYINLFNQVSDKDKLMLY